MKISNFTCTVIAVVLLGAMVNFIGGTVIGTILFSLWGGGTSGAAAAILLALVGTGSLNYFLFIGALRNHFRQEAEDKLHAEIMGEGEFTDEPFEQTLRAGDVNFPQAQPRRADEANFK